MKIKVNQKVYVIIQDESYDGQVGAGAWVFEKREDAEKKLASLCASAEEWGCLDKKEIEPKDYIDYWQDGWYDRWHYHAVIEERELL